MANIHCIQLTPDQHQEIIQNGKDPVRALDPVTEKEYVLVPAEDYVRWQHLVSDRVDVREAYPAIDRSFAEGWNDPRMDEYDRYEELKP
mgnify:CR=1 FL=1